MVGVSKLFDKELFQVLMVNSVLVYCMIFACLPAQFTCFMVHSYLLQGIRIVRMYFLFLLGFMMLALNLLCANRSHKARKSANVQDLGSGVD